MKSRSVEQQLCRNLFFFLVIGTSFRLGPVHVSPSGDDSIIARHMLPEVEHLASCIDRQSVPLLCTLYLKCMPSDCVSVSSFTQEITLRSCSSPARLERSVNSIIRKCGILTVVVTSSLNEQRAVQETCRGPVPHCV